MTRTDTEPTYKFTRAERREDEHSSAPPQSILGGLKVRIVEQWNRNSSKTFRGRAVLPDGTDVSRVLLRTIPKPLKYQLRDARDEALRRAALYDRELFPERYPGGTYKARRVEDAVEEYLDSIRGRQAAGTVIRAERVLYSYSEHLGRVFLIEWMDKIKGRQISGENPQRPGWRWERAAEGIQPNTLYCEMATIKSFLRWSWEQGYLRRPIEIRMPTCPNPMPPVILDDERVREVVFWHRDHQPHAQKAAALAVLALTGMRTGELASLPADAYDPETRTLTIPKGQRETTKRHGRVIPVGTRLANILADWCAKHVGEESPPTLFYSIEGKILTRQANHWLKPLSAKPIDLRRWCINTLHRLRIAQVWVDMIVGHVPNHVDRHYTCPTLEDMREALQGVEDRLFGESE